jgi:GxxExxY protein
MSTDERTTARRPEHAPADSLHADLTHTIIAAAFAVHNTLGRGLLEKVYENALAWELTRRGAKAVQQQEYRVTYAGKDVGAYLADLVVNDKVIVEAKAVEKLDTVHEAQLLNYMRISGLRVGLLINFAGARLEYHRFVL